MKKYLLLCSVFFLSCHLVDEPKQIPVPTPPAQPLNPVITIRDYCKAISESLCTRINECNDFALDVDKCIFIGMSACCKKSESCDYILSSKTINLTKAINQCKSDILSLTCESFKDKKKNMPASCVIF